MATGREGWQLASTIVADTGAMAAKVPDISQASLYDRTPPIETPVA